MNNDMDSVPVRNILGVSIHAATMDQVVAACVWAIVCKERLMIGVVNAAKLVGMREDPLLFDAVAKSDIVLADGASIVWAGRVLGQQLPERVAGIDLFEELLAVADRHRFSVYFFGAAPAVLTEVLRLVRIRYPHLRVAGARDGYFADQQAEEVATDIRNARADMLFVAITSPKKELFLRRWGHELDVAVCHGVGGSFDVIAGKAKRAPPLWQKLGLEWLYRLIQEPRRMWRRYLVTNTLFATMVFREFIRNGRSHRAN